eukprot:1650346-Prymnesium_polylepis.1
MARATVQAAGAPARAHEPEQQAATTPPRHPIGSPGEPQWTRPPGGRQARRLAQQPAQHLLGGGARRQQRPRDTHGETGWVAREPRGAPPPEVPKRKAQHIEPAEPLEPAQYDCRTAATCRQRLLSDGRKLLRRLCKLIVVRAQAAHRAVKMSMQKGDPVVLLDLERECEPQRGDHIRCALQLYGGGLHGSHGRIEAADAQRRRSGRHHTLLVGRSIDLVLQLA